MISSASIKDDHWINSDAHFDKLYPFHIQQLSDKHWTPLEISRISSEFLAVESGVKVLDVGSGVGKFCLSASHFKPEAVFVGIEQRKSLVKDAERARQMLRFQNVSFLHGNFTQLVFKEYNHFYFYNSFFENVDHSQKIDDSIQYSVALFKYYSAYLYKELKGMPLNTKIATYCSWGDEIPPSYKLVSIKANGLLKFYINTRDSMIHNGSMVHSNQKCIL